MRADDPPPRPRDLTPEALEFCRRAPVRWFSPTVLVAAGLRATLSAAFGSFLDKRELQARLESVVAAQHADRPELWLDYVADTGDGFDATYSVATLLARRELTVEGWKEPLPRGHVLVLGGDQTYPVATSRDYTDRLEGPFRAALPWTAEDHPTLVALPGNHDWYDGLTGFLRQFAQQRWIGGWRTCQTRSYFALQLPHRWWLWGMDIQHDHYVDEPQLDFFSGVLEHAQPGDRMVLATAAPTWIKARSDPAVYRNLAFVEDKLLRPRGIRLEVVLAGDLHHYNRYVLRPGPDPPGTGDPGDPGDPGIAGTPTHRITSGGGGAFLYPTHELPARLRLPADARTATSGTGGTRAAGGLAGDPAAPRRRYHDYELAACYPPAARSRWLGLGALLMPFRNPGAVWIVGLSHMVLLWTNQFGIRSETGTPGPRQTFRASAERSGWVDLTRGLFDNSLSVLLLVVLALGLIGLAEAPVWARPAWLRSLCRVVLGLVHGAAHVATVVAVSLLAIRLAGGLEGVWFTAVTSVVDGLLGGVAGAVVLGGYFALATTLPGLKVHANEAFSAARLTWYKNFLRLHIDRDGQLTVYAIGLDRIAHRWHPGDPAEADPEQPWLEPDVELTPHLIERVVVG